MPCWCLIWTGTISHDQKHKQAVNFVVKVLVNVKAEVMLSRLVTSAAKRATSLGIGLRPFHLASVVNSIEVRV